MEEEYLELKGETVRGLWGIRKKKKAITGIVRPECNKPRTLKAQITRENDIRWSLKCSQEA